MGDPNPLGGQNFDSKTQNSSQMTTHEKTAQHSGLDSAQHHVSDKQALKGGNTDEIVPTDPGKTGLGDVKKKVSDASAKGKTPGGGKSESEDEEEDEKRVLEESPNKRWSKTAAQVKQRDIPGIDVAYLAMDNETGQEVVWNEVQFSERKNFRAQEEKIKAVFLNLTQLQHANLVKFHKYWTDNEPKTDKPRIVFITEYMSSGSMSQFLKRTRKSNTSLSEKSWKKWVVQILSALNYLHSCDPVIAHGNLSTNTIFIQQNGLIKIGCVAPNAIHQHVKTFRENMKNMHYIAPEYEVGGEAVTEATDIYAFGICALEMACLGFNTNGDSSQPQIVTPELIQKKLQSLENPLQKDFIEKCLMKNWKLRPTARELLFHSVLYGVHSLKLLAAHRLVTAKTYDAMNMDDFRIRESDKNKVIAEIQVMGGKGPKLLKYSDVNIIEELDKFVEDVNNGIYPLYAFELPKKPFNFPSSGIGDPSETPGSHGMSAVSRSKSPEQTSNSGNGGGQTKENEKDWDMESRRIIRMAADLKPPDSGEGILLKLMLKLDDQMNRELTTQIKSGEEPIVLAQDLVDHGFISEPDKDMIAKLLSESMQAYFRTQQAAVNSNQMNAQTQPVVPAN